MLSYHQSFFINGLLGKELKTGMSCVLKAVGNQVVGHVISREGIILHDCDTAGISRYSHELKVFDLMRIVRDYIDELSEAEVWQLAGKQPDVDEKHVAKLGWVAFTPYSDCLYNCYSLNDFSSSAIMVIRPEWIVVDK
ncbi:hypothetical protein J6A31_07560 [bacterium]|nr:hypothetical protein [bacterium]